MPLRYCLALAFVAGAGSLAGAAPQGRPGGANSAASAGLPPSGVPQGWVEAAGENQRRILADEDRLPLRYRVHKVDARGDVVREVIESSSGNVARLIGRNAAPLTAEEDKAERARLEGILAAPGDFLNREGRDRASHRYALELIAIMPRAMLWSFTPGQPQPANAHRAQVVIDFTPDPAFKPPNMVAEALTGIAGRLWIDAQSRCVTRVEGHILHPVNFGWGGMLARISSGGTLAFEQTEAGEGRWLYSRLSEHLVVREVLVHTVHQDAEINVFDAQRLPTLPSYGDAIHALLAIPVPTR